MLKRFERDVGDVPIGKTFAPTVVANEAKAIGKEMVQVCPKRVVPFMLDVRKPAAGSHKGHTPASARYCKIDSILGSTESDFLITRDAIGSLLVRCFSP